MKSRHRAVTFLVPFLLFSLFAILALTSVLFSARIYRNIVTADEAAYYEMTPSSYLREKIRRAKDVWLDEDVLVLQEDDMITYIYVHEGNLMELDALQDLPFDKKAGEAILPMDDMKISIHDNLLKAQLTYKNKTTETDITLHQ